MARKLGVDEVLQRLFDDDFGLSEDDSSDKDGEGILPTLDSSILMLLGRQL